MSMIFMKKQNSILLPGIISIIILITAQVIIVNGVWKQKDEMFNLRYRLFSRDALENMSRRFRTDGFDTARILIGRYSAIAAKEMAETENDSLLEVKKKDVLYFVEKVLNQEQDLSNFLSGYFGSQGIEKNFNYRIVVNYFELIYKDKRFSVYTNGQVPVEGKKSLDRNDRGNNLKLSNAILVKGDRSEDNNYRLDFEYYIDFRDKQKIVLRDMAVSLGLSIFSILAVVALFLVTYRNLMEEKRLSNLKTDFINNMTHELKTPLSTISVAGKTLEMPQINRDERKILDTARLIGKQSVHLNQMINMMLEISMWERTQFQLEKKKTDIGEALRDITESFKNGCGNCARFIESYSFGGKETELDLVYFTTLMNNLLSNAVKYSEGEPVIEIKGYIEDKNAIIEVTDNGIGISKADQKHIFDKFYRASTGNIHRYKGLGLGLYYVKKIAEAHGGDVSVSSKTGRGSTFTVTFPC